MIPLAANESFSKAPVRVADLDGNGTPDVVAIVGGQVQVLLNQKLRPPPAPAPGNAGVPVLPGGSKAGTATNPLGGIKYGGKSVTAGHGGTLTFGTATNPPTASAALTLTLPAKGATGNSLTTTQSGKKAKGKKKPVVLGAGKVAIPAGKTRPLTVHLNAKGKALLRKGPLHATLTIVATGTDGKKATSSSGVVVKPAKVKKKSHK